MSVPNAAPPVKPLTIALVGDIHDQWQEADATALKGLRVDLVLFVGDFGNESVDVVRQVAALDLPKAAVFGNHDAWYTATPWGQRKRPYNPAEEDRFQEQLNLLASVHVGYGRCDFPALNLSVVGSRPFSWGGPEWKTKTFYRDRFKVESFEQSTARIVAAAQASPYSTILMIGHNGPTGLGAQPEDLCGKDWHPVGGDYGDPDFAAAIAQLKTQGKHIPLVGFGHMHHDLRHRKDRLRTPTQFQDQTLYLNAARCPRIQQFEGQSLRNFSLVTLVGGQVHEACLVWVNAVGQVLSQEKLFYQPPLTVAIANVD